MSQKPTSQRGSLMHRLRAGLPLSDGEQGDWSEKPYSIQQLTALLHAEVQAAVVSDASVLCFRIRHRPFGFLDDDNVQMVELRSELTDVLHSIHPGIRAVGSPHGEVVGFVPQLQRRGDGDAILSDIARKMSEPIMVDGLLVLLGPRVSGAVLDAETSTAVELLDASKVALAETDASRVVVMFHPYQRARETRANDMARALHDAVVARELTTDYQPDIDLDTGEIVAIKAYARWERNGGVVLNNDLFEAAERASLHVPIGRQVIEESLRAVYSWISTGLIDRTTLWVNVHPLEMLAPDFSAKMATVAAFDERLRLGLELTEIPREDAKYIYSVLRSLVAKGAVVAVSGFGAGRFDVAEIPRLPFSVVKIDRTIVAQMAASADSVAVVDCLISLAGRLGLSATAQGIETSEQLAQLRAMGLRTGQGFHFARPMSGENMKALLADHKAGRRFR